MCDYPFFIPQVVLFANSSLFWFKVTNEHREFRNYLILYKILLSFYTSVFWYGNQKFSEQKKDHLNGLFGIRAARSFQ